jgi:hypothetical protein
MLVAAHSRTDRGADPVLAIITIADDDSDDEPAVEDALKAEPSSSQPPSSAGLPPLPSFKKIPPTSTTASSTTTDETHALGNEVVMSEPNAPGPAVTAGQASDASTRPSDMPDEGLVSSFSSFPPS